MRYLLGELSEQEKASLEERFFSDDQEFEELEVAETELIDQYLADELSPGDRTLFEKRLVTSPRLVERVRISRILASRLASFGEPQPVSTVRDEVVPTPTLPWWRKLFGSQTLLSPAFAAALVLILVAGVALAIVWSRYRSESQRLAAETQQRVELERQIAELKSRSDQLDQDLQQAIREREEALAKFHSQSPQTDEPLSHIATLFLMPGAVRSAGGGKDLPLSSEISAVDLDLDVSDSDYSSYAATVQTPEGKVVARKPNLKPIQSRG
ncbi:MAG: hypothetical protein DMF69_17730, partial [Acidobacteria bacterium]